MHFISYALRLDSMMTNASEHQANQVVLPCRMLIVVAHQNPSVKDVLCIHT